MAAALLLLIACVDGQAKSGGKQTGGGQLGILECRTVPGSGYSVLIHSSVDVSCLFQKPDAAERYKGEMGIGLGVDLRWNRRETIRFAVVGLAADTRAGKHALAGKYAGGKASVSIGYGLGADALIGGGEKGIALQPLGIENTEGFGVAAGLGYLILRPD
jgi:hypothetical protein